ncbi:hypothetical protein A2U01_0040781, partial [Trifolium medium]|nr:hypothetical protein [Trifolium medium]
KILSCTMDEEERDEEEEDAAVVGDTCEETDDSHDIGFVFSQYASYVLDVWMHVGLLCCCCGDVIPNVWTS